MRSISGIGGHFAAQMHPVWNQALCATPSQPSADANQNYPKGDGTFSSDVRGIQPQPKRDLHFAMMANDVYHSNAKDTTGTQSERELAEAGWTRLTLDGDKLVDAQKNHTPISPSLLHDKKTGFDAAIYQNKQGQYVIAFRGTDSWSLGTGGDSSTNLGQGTGLFMGQYQQAIALAKEAEQVFGKGNVAFTGHSLGGGLASAAMLVTGAPGVIFNAAGLSDGTMRRMGFSNPSTVRAELADSGQIRSYNVTAELLTSIQHFTVLPDAIGYELRVAPPKNMEFHPVVLHGDGADGASYVEALRENTPWHPKISLLRHTAEFRQKLMAAAGSHAWGSLTDAGAVVKQASSEMSAVRDDMANGRMVEGSGRAVGSIVNGVTDMGAVSVRHATDLAGDVLMQGAILGGNFLRKIGEWFGIPSFLPAFLARTAENMGYQVNQTIDTAGKIVAAVLDKTGNTIQQYLSPSQDR